MSNPNRFRFSIDRGGTFTDIYAEVPGEPGYRVIKLLSDDPENYADAPLEGIRRILDEFAPSSGNPDAPIEWIRMGTTLATNALLERKGVRCGLVITKGFGDLLRIGKQNRPRIFDLEIKQPQPVYEAMVEVEERVRLAAEHETTAGGTTGLGGETLHILQPPDLPRLENDLRGLRGRGIDSLAVVCMHAYTFPDHERQIGRLAGKLGFRHVALSHRVMPRIKIVDRGQTCCVDAYLTPLIERYLQSFRSGPAGRRAPLFLMQSDGGLVEPDRFTGSRAILSGPAGGVVGCAKTAFPRFRGKPVIGFDMGGTSTDVSRYVGDFEWVHETEAGGVALLAPQLHIKTVAAGGGSRLFFKNGLFVVGPESSGAHPGPVCYGKNGFLSITDANLVLGRLLPDYFPKLFGPSGGLPLDVGAAQTAFNALAREVNACYRRAGKDALAPETIAEGFVRVADEVMTRVIREISVARGFDVRDHVLACFGGAGGQHACAVARALGISKIFIHRFAGILSAYGLGLADVVLEKQEPASTALCESSLPELNARLDALGREAADGLQRKGFPENRIGVRHWLNLRYQGTDTAMMIPRSDAESFEQQFRARYRREFGFDLADREILVDDLRVRGIGKTAGTGQRPPLPAKTQPTPPATHTRCWFDGAWRRTPVFLLEAMGPAETVPGPAILINNTSTILVDPSSRAVITEFGDVEINVPARGAQPVGTEADPVQLSLFGNRFMSIAEQMGRALQRTAVSTNIKERLDFSCALFDGDGSLVANAPHLPVHLGAMGEAVRRQIRRQGNSLNSGDTLVTNHPTAGGSHLPDITVITPVIKNGRPVFFVANRGHHADIGGISPGSMPPFSQSLSEEGVCIESFKLVENGVFQERGIAALLTAPPYGTRALADNVSDLKAQVAANKRGADLLDQLVGEHSLETVQAYMKHIQQNAEDAVRGMLRRLSSEKSPRPTDTLSATDYLDDGSPIVLRLTLDRESGGAIFDFTGTGAQLPGNCNAPRAVTWSAVLYVLRCLVQDDSPLNQGCLQPIRVIIEDGSLLAPSATAAVCGGNVLTSQRVTDVILKAFGAAAASQGCMNNLTFGNDRFAYYETIGGGAGAGPHWHGRSGVHTHMTNTRITDPEILEKRYPVLLRQFAIRRNSGGNGKYRGGDGLVREIEFLQPLNAAILSERRVYAPYGLQGGEPGARGQNLLIKKNGDVIDLGGKNETTVEPGDRIRILTPGGGGFGSPTED